MMFFIKKEHELINAVKKIIQQSTITCPNCGHKKEETMPTEACRFFYECENCKTKLKPKSGGLLCLLQLRIN